MVDNLSLGKIKQSAIISLLPYLNPSKIAPLPFLLLGNNVGEANPIYCKLKESRLFTKSSPSAGML